MLSNHSVGLIGIGNVLLKDERLGVHVVKTIKEKYSCPTGLEIIDGGTLGLDLLPYFEQFEKVIFVDAINFGKEPGYIGVLEDKEIPAVIFPKLSAHNIGLADLLSVAMLKGVMPSKVCLIGMQPSSGDFSLGLEMSDIVNANMDKLIDTTLQKLKKWNLECILKS
jgi:hydrogenase maturation protease